MRLEGLEIVRDTLLRVPQLKSLGLILIANNITANCTPYLNDIIFHFNNLTSLELNLFANKIGNPLNF